MTSDSGGKAPGFLMELLKKNRESTTIQFLSFNDWLEHKDSRDWIVVANLSHDESEQFGTFSALVRKQDGAIARIVREPGWDVHLDFGHPTFHGSSLDGTWTYDDGTSMREDDLEFLPFVFYRTYHEVKLAEFEILQGFLLYHEAFLQSKDGMHYSINELGIPEPVVKRSNDGLMIQVRADYLRDYLSAVGCYLVRYHDHRRWAKDDIEAKIGGEFKSFIASDTLSCFELWLRTDIPFRDFKSSSRLIGQDLILPYLTPNKHHLRHITPNTENEFVEFIVRIDESGNAVESTCNEGELSNFYVDRGTPHSLTPVYFNLQVLDKYYGEPGRFKASWQGVSCLDLWSIEISVNEENLVQVYLSDLGRLPYAEQLHWKSFNVPPRGTVPKSRIMRDFMCEFTPPENDIVYYFKQAFEEVQRHFHNALGDTLFRPLDRRDVYLYESLHLPSTDDWSEFDAQIQALAKIVVDSLNIPFLESQTGISHKPIESVTSLTLLTALLEKWGVKEKRLDELIDTYRAVQTLRSVSAAHRKGGSLDAALQRYDMMVKSNIEIVGKLVCDLTNSFKLLSECIQSVNGSSDGSE